MEISNKFRKHNAKENFQISRSRNLNCHVRRDKGKSERAEGHETLHTAGDPTGY